MTINELAELVHANAVEKGFHPEKESRDDFIKQTCNNIHGEVSELWEAWRKGEIDLPCDKECDLTSGQEELADILIRALDSMKQLGYNPEQIILAKHRYNLTRSFRHGNKLA